MVKYFDSLDEAKAYLQNRGKLISCNSESSVILHKFIKYGLIPSKDQIKAGPAQDGEYFEEDIDQNYIKE